MTKKEKNTLIILVIVGFFTFINNAMAATYYVRPDGGTAEQCTGLVDEPYPGSGTDQDCAWFHYYEAMPPAEYNTPVRISGGDTLIIKSGSYMHGASDYYNGSGCRGVSKYQCSPKPIPSGPDASHPTRILGEGWDIGCQNPPELWGIEKIKNVIDLTNSSNVEVQCLELTDHESCAQGFRRDPTDPQNCEYYKVSDSELGNWAKNGIFSGTYGEPYNTSSNVLLKNINSHGFASAGLNASHLTNWTIENCSFNYNGKSGFNGDVSPSKGENDFFSGIITIQDTDISWNGCIENWEHPGTVTKCFDQNEGGYGDGIGTGPAGTAAWVLDNVTVNYNTSDGVDLLYQRYEDGAQAKIINSHVEGNAGNGIKLGATALLENNVLIGNCDYWYDKSYSVNIIRCRGGGSVLSLSLTYGHNNYIVNNTFTGEAPAIITAAAGGETDWEGGHHYFYNNFLQGVPLYRDATRQADWEYAWNIDPDIHLTNEYWFVYNAGNIGRYNLCSTPGTTCKEVNPLLIELDPVADSYDLHFSSPDSPVIGTGMIKDTLLGTWGKFNEEVRIPNNDKDGNQRPSQTSFGAYEYFSEVNIIRTDVDQNQIINTTDAMLTLRNSLELNMSNTNWKDSITSGDVNCDNVSNLFDAVLILRYSLDLDMSGTDWCG